MKLAYLSGKYSDARGPIFVERYINYSMEVAIQLWSLGIAVICPHTNTRHFDGATDYATFIEGDLLMVERVDLVVMLDNWNLSNGAKLERWRAMEKGICVFEWPYNLELILKFCWPKGVPYKYIESSRSLLSEELHGKVNECQFKAEQATGCIHQ